MPVHRLEPTLLCITSTHLTLDAGLGVALLCMFAGGHHLAACSALWIKTSCVFNSCDCVVPRKQAFCEMDREHLQRVVAEMVNLVDSIT